MQMAGRNIGSNMRPLPAMQGVGFFTMVPLPEEQAKGFRVEIKGRYHNYHATSDNWTWPELPKQKTDYIIDGFSPNLNKFLHIGHLRNLALAKSLSEILTGSKFVAMLGYSLGTIEGAEQKLHEWLNLVGYHPDYYRDTAMAEVEIPTVPGEGEFAGCEVWQGSKRPVVLTRSNGSTTYAHHDLAFAKMVSPDYYLTGQEQTEHFANLGFGEKHLPMGLILDPTSHKKMKSRDGTAFTAEEAIKAVIERLRETPLPRQLAWNVLAWNFLRISREKDINFNVDDWTKTESPGLYITYTLARIRAALSGVKVEPTNGLQEADVKLLGIAGYLPYWKQRSIEALDPSPLANYALALAQQLGVAYHSERIADGRPAFQFAVKSASDVLSQCMTSLGMFTLTEV